jgi:outer membrane protein
MMKRLRFPVFGFRLWLAAAVAAAAHGAEPTLDLTYRKAIEQSLAKNFQIQVQQYNPKIARARTFSESGRFDPRVEASLTYDENYQNLRTLNFDGDDPNRPAGRFARRAGLEVDTGVIGLTPWGMTYDFGSSLTQNTDNQRSANQTRYDTFIGGVITQPLLQGFGTDVNLAAIRIARADQAISGWQLRQRIIDVVTDTINVYNDLFFSIRNLEVQRRSRELAMQTLSDNSKRAEIGVMSPLDVVQAQADVASREEQVLVAERAVADNENFLKQLVTDEITRVLETRIRIAPPPFETRFTSNEKEDLAKAFELRPDYREALLEIQKRDINLVFTRNQTLPRLDLVASLGLNGIDTSVGESIRAVGDPSNLAWSVGGVFSLPVPNRTARGELEISKLEIAQALVALKQLEQGIYVEVDNAAGQVETTRKRIEASRVARVFAERTLDAAQSRLASGTATTFEVLQFQRDLAQAEVNEILALTDHMKAIAAYARATGTTLDQNAILLE